jgi:metallophosphoesterase (TIGR00282 family)
VKTLFIGDIVGKPGRRALRELLPSLRERFGTEVVVANAENAAGGFGMTAKVLSELRSLGVDVLTTGNHIWDKKEAIPLLEAEPRLLRPANYPPGVKGSGRFRHLLPDGRVLWVLNLQGRVLMPPVDCPFRKADDLLAAIPEGERCILVDFHAEATSEKRAMGFYLDGRASLVVGTHTHVPTADAEVLPRGTGYQTDAGMTGAYASVIGMEIADSTERILTGIPRILEVATRDVRLSGLFAEIDEGSGRCLRVEAFQERLCGTAP